MGGMKALALAALGILASIGIWFSTQETAVGQTGGRIAAAPGTPPIGAICEVRVLASILVSKTEIEVVKGNLLALSTEWIVLKDGSFENWVPRDKVITMRASR